MSIDTTSLRKQLASIDARCGALAARYSADLGLVDSRYAHSARNLLHYIAMRQTDLRDLQDSLAALGLSSLGRAESHVQASIRAVDRALACLAGTAQVGGGEVDAAFRTGRLRTDTHAADLLGPHREGRDARIMVTLPTEAADNYALVHDLVATGMDVARINCAHDGPDQWLRMIGNVQRAAGANSRDCRIAMDLMGPKHRTGPLMAGPRVLRLRPRHDAVGRLTSAKRLRFIADDSAWEGHKKAVVPVARECIEQAEAEDEIRFTDTRGRKRKLRVVAKDGDTLILELRKPAYIATGTRLRLINSRTGERSWFTAGQLPPVAQPIILHTDDLLILERGNAPGEPARIAADGTVLKPAHVACKPGEIFAHVSAGDAVMLNDGKIEGTVESAAADKLVVRITQAKPTGSRLRGDRGINFPQSDLTGNGLTALDRRHLEFIVEHADAVGLSFVREPADVLAVHDALRHLTDKRLGVILKIETEPAFRNLPRILLAAMRSYPLGIMIARGDLAVECGWARLAEIQEEILWLCEAAHVPVIWATQVLEGKAKKGLPTRAEITDAAMSQRADCVMLNKGRHILAAIRMLDEILRRMQQHQYKKSTRLRKLSVADI